MEYIKELGWLNRNKKIKVRVKSKNNEKKTKKYKIIATISLICAILMLLDYMLVQKFIDLLQTLN